MELLMIEALEGVTILTRDVDLIYSPDDEAETGKGYYLSQTSTGKISRFYGSKQEAIASFRYSDGKVRWRNR